MISIIIPSHNSLELLKITLDCLAQQQSISPEDFEVIVANDGSTDGTSEYCQTYPGLRLVLLDLERGTGNPGYGRNAGIEIARGELLVFLDAGILLPPDYLSTIKSKYTGMTETLVVHDILGIFTEKTEESDLLVKELLSSYASPSSFQGLLGTLRENPTWSDPRRELLHGFPMFSGDKLNLHAPWAYVWSGSLVCSKEVIRLDIRFGHGFKGWGSEDQAFAYESYIHDFVILYDPELTTVHIPHRHADSKVQRRSALENRKILYHRYPSLELEIFAHTYSTHMEPLLSYLSSLIYAYLLPTYAEDLLDTFRAHLFQNQLMIPSADAISPSSLAIGWSDGVVLRKLAVTDVFYLNEAQKNQLVRDVPELNISQCLGILTSFPRSYFSCVIFNDYLRLLPLAFLDAFLEEVFRIGQRVFFLSDLAHKPYGCNVYGLNWHDQETIFSKLSCRCVSIQESGGQILWELFR